MGSEDHPYCLPSILVTMGPVPINTFSEGFQPMLPFDSEQNEMFAIPRSAWNAVQEEHEMLYARCLALEKKLHELGQESIDIHGAKRKPLTLAQSLALQFRLVANHCFPSDFQFVLAGYGQLSQERNGHHVIQALFLNLLRCPEKHNAGLQATLEEHSQAILYDSLAKGANAVAKVRMHLVQIAHQFH